MKRKLLGACLLFAVLLELSLRLLATRLPPVVANELVRTYTTSIGGMYLFDLACKANFCLPNHSQTAFFNGYTWHHQADSRGFRNPPNTASEVVLLGDSFVYGHGVEESQTAAAFLRTLRGWKVYNMARQGDGICQEYIVFRLFPELKPRKVILFPFVNDFGDMAAMRSDAELAQPIELSLDYPALRKRLADPSQTFQVGDWRDFFYSYRLFDFARRYHRATGPPAKNRYMDALLNDKLRSELGAYYEKLFVDMLKICRQNQSELEVVYLWVDLGDSTWRQSEILMDEYLSDLCRRHGVKYRNTRQLFKNHPEMTLPGDSHLSPQGHRALAEWL